MARSTRRCRRGSAVARPASVISSRGRTSIRRSCCRLRAADRPRSRSERCRFSDVATIDDLVDQSLQRPRSLSLLVARLRRRGAAAVGRRHLRRDGVLRPAARPRTSASASRSAGGRRSVLGLIVGQGMMVVAGGVAVGLAVAARRRAADVEPAVRRRRRRCRHLRCRRRPHARCRAGRLLRSGAARDRRRTRGSASERVTTLNSQLSTLKSQGSRREARGSGHRRCQSCGCVLLQ